MGDCKKHLYYFASHPLHKNFTWAPIPEYYQNEVYSELKFILEVHVPCLHVLRIFENFPDFKSIFSLFSLICHTLCFGGLEYYSVPILVSLSLLLLAMA
jgi:hypothetical protein